MTIAAEPFPPVGLTAEHCRARRQALLDRLATRGIGAALLVGRQHVHYFTGHWSRSVFASAALLRAGEPALIALPHDAAVPAVEVVHFVGSRLATLVDHPADAAADVLLRHVAGDATLASDRPTFARATVPLAQELVAMRRAKWPDEVGLLRHAVRACEAAYAAAAELIRPGLVETELFAAVLSAVTLAAGEPVGELGNDFRSGEGGGPARHRAMRAGELLPLDLGVCVRGYTADLCRTFAVGGRPSAIQIEAHARVVAVLDDIEAMAGPGVSCRSLYDHAARRLSGVGGATFGHHLGHGVGLAAHEGPRLNPNWDDTLAAGDVFTVEPGLYAPALNGGVRVEQMFHVEHSGVRRMSHFPVALTP